MGAAAITKKPRKPGSGGARAGSGRKPSGFITVELATRISQDELQVQAREMMARLVYAVTQVMPKLIMDEIEDAQRGDKKARERLLDRFLGKPKDSVVTEQNAGSDVLAKLMAQLLEPVAPDKSAK